MFVPKYTRDPKYKGFWCAKENLRAFGFLGLRGVHRRCTAVPNRVRSRSFAIYPLQILGRKIFLCRNSTFLRTNKNWRSVTFRVSCHGTTSSPGTTARHSFMPNRALRWMYREGNALCDYFCMGHFIWVENSKICENVFLYGLKHLFSNGFKRVFRMGFIIWVNHRCVAC